MVLVVAFNGLLLGGIALIWGFLNSLELILYLPLVNISFPALIVMIYSVFIPISTMDIVPEDVTLYLFNLSSDIPNENNDRLQLLEKESTITILNLGTLFYFFLITLIFFWFALVFSEKLPVKLKKTINKMTQ